MTTINLRELYPWYTEDAFIEVSDEVAAFLEEDRRLQINYAQYIRDNKAFYSLDAGLKLRPAKVLLKAQFRKRFHADGKISGIFSKSFANTPNFCPIFLEVYERDIILARLCSLTTA